ncbi:grainyhead-like protein 3 homolog isoform X1 [Chiloscyllium plagiosum]|uniref:grainyhead-like protein 3 homolog isoform X1 n=3 Tax=Chiloscyllium plagiosum TaxID=36176 RepID=UPI001CB7B93F|nr:grainyhead-like protein 3 homolog isoform X1 [Chiloscyllium plagiosum]XP_043573623.1 grainyhead-like protein 3 homolog isoform X1 [Chiloscyllium plagiosum]XP_043573624.1 grainyhead-like protein 3 homolog isoform X1 [Chiloscyllium plagiosum]
MKERKKAVGADEFCLRPVMVLHNEAVNFQRHSVSNEDEAWKNYLENPLTAATKAMMSINGDDESVAALSFLYDYYKVPKQERLILPGKVPRPCESNLVKRSNTGNGFEFDDMTSLDCSIQSMKLLPEDITMSTEYPDPDKRSHRLQSDSIFTASKSQPLLDNYTSIPTDLYDCNLIDSFDNILMTQLPQRWAPENNFKDAFKDMSPEAFLNDLIKPSCVEENVTHDKLRVDFEYMLEAPKSVNQKPGEESMGYLNKGQFYPITLKAMHSDKCLQSSSTKVRSMIMAVFDNAKTPEDQVKYWKHWHSRQHTVKQRVIDFADYKESNNTINCVEEVAFNALSFIWDSNKEAKVYIGINCLSTDFSSQKGVKGLPLNLQIDTYDCEAKSEKPIHRAVCQIKIFVDKGAERKMRDEERKQSKRKSKFPDSTTETTDNKRIPLSDHKGSDTTYFKPVTDLISPPILFTPEAHFLYSQRTGLGHSMSCEVTNPDRFPIKRDNKTLYKDELDPPIKQARLCEPERVLLYVRRESEEVFDALLLKTPDLNGLKNAISEKYGLLEERIYKIYKNCMKGILVNMDDNIVQHYCNHAAFLVEIKDVNGGCQITLKEV